MLAKVSTLLRTVGLPHRPLTAGNGGRGPRLAAVALDGGHQRGLLAADEGAGAHADLEVEVEAGAQDVLAQQAVLARLLDGVLEPLDGQRVLGAHVDVALVRADGVGGDGHALDDAVRVAFQHASGP